MHRVRSNKMGVSGFTPSEIERMENVLRKVNERSITQSFYEKVAQRLNLSAQLGDSTIKPHQVQDWFQSKQAVPTSPSSVSKSLKAKKLGDHMNADTAVESTVATLNDADDIIGLNDTEFEARSSKDGAWYDVASILTQRKTSKNAIEVLVRYVGFGAEEDEWVSLKEAVRKRSLPLEPSECCKVGVGNFVLCFRERRDVASYYDAIILEIKRRLHDVRGCRCIFLVRYDHDKSEEKVPLRRLCLRPKH